MKLKEFIKQLKKIAKSEGDSEVIMADGISVVEPVFSNGYQKPSVVITDQR